MDIMDWVGTVGLGAFICNQSFGSDLRAKFPPASTRSTKCHIPALAWVTRLQKSDRRPKPAVAPATPVPHFALLLRMLGLAVLVLLVLTPQHPSLPQSFENDRNFWAPAVH